MLRLDPVVQQALYGALAFVVFIVIFTIVLWRIRLCRYKKKCVKILAKDEILPTQFDDLRISQMGDSTCKVIARTISSSLT